MEVDLKIITQLREQTGAGIGDCKKALEESNGDINKAVEYLRKKGETKAAKKSDRSVNEGLVAMATEGQKVATVVLNCETDFVAKNEDFISAVNNFAQKLLTTSIEDFMVWAEENIKNELVVKIGENIQLGDFGIIEGNILGIYLHANKKIAAVISLSDGTEDLAKDIAMHTVAMSPVYLKSEDIPAEVLEKEKEIYREQLKQEGKPENIWDKIIEGKLNKYYEDVCLLNQSFVKDEDKKIADLLKEAGEGVTIKDFKRYSV